MHRRCSARSWSSARDYTFALGSGATSQACIAFRRRPEGKCATLNQQDEGEPGRRPPDSERRQHGKVLVSLPAFMAVSAESTTARNKRFNVRLH